MRVVGGSLRGREVRAPKGRTTRPMTDRTREGLFNILGDISGFWVLDAYAGSGAVGIEALSRGADSVDAVEKNFKAAQTIRKNVQELGLGDQYGLFHEPIQKWLKENADKSKRYDLVFVCPPHSLLNQDVLKQINPYLKPGGLLVVEHFFKDQVPALEAVKFIRTISYGESALSLYRKP